MQIVIPNQSEIQFLSKEVEVMPQPETIYEDRRGRMRLKVFRKPSRFGLRYSAIIYRPYKREEDELGNPLWEQTHWLDERDILNSRRLHEVADDIIAEARRSDSLNQLDRAG
jgi:hypothetical protein